MNNVQPNIAEQRAKAQVPKWIPRYYWLLAIPVYMVDVHFRQELRNYQEKAWAAEAYKHPYSCTTYVIPNPKGVMC